MAEEKQRVVLATHNAGKVRELAGPLADFGVEVIGLEAFPQIEAVSYTHLTLPTKA